jgi:hypothetical protein
MKEEWRDVPGAEGLYQVSSKGRVKSLDRVVEYVDGRKVRYKGKMLKCGKSGRYITVMLTKKKSCRVHVLVAMAFLGHVPNKFKTVVDHINGDSKDNRVENLRVVTHRENCNNKVGKYSSKYPGVHWDKERNKWVAYIRINGKKKNLGRYEKEEDARDAYLKAIP